MPISSNDTMTKDYMLNAGQQIQNNMPLKKIVKRNAVALKDYQKILYLLNNSKIQKKHFHTFYSYVMYFCLYIQQSCTWCEKIS